MKSRWDELARRRAALIARAEAQRAELAFYARELEGPARIAESLGGFLNSVRRSPLLITGLAAVLIRTPWRKLARWPKWIWRGWRAAQFVRGWTR